MKLWASVCFCIYGIVVQLQESRAIQSIALEAEVGEDVVLPCPSNDDDHRFFFWQLVGDQVIGPGNPIDLNKYKYEVLTGLLSIKAVTSEENGLYKCVTKQLTGSGLQIKGVELVVRKDWESEWETDESTNVYRSVIAIGVLLGLAIIGILMYYVYRRQQIINRIKSLSGDADEESPDEALLKGTYNSTTVPSTSSRGMDNPVDTEFPTTFQTLH